VSIGGCVFALNYQANMELPGPWMLYVSNQRGFFHALRFSSDN
jgi:hypothetical protein